MKKLLVANRGEIAIRIMRAGAEINIPTVAVYPRDDANSLHTGKAEEAKLLKGSGTKAYLDIESIINAAKESDCDALHPGCGFLAENAQFARRCREEGILFIGPTVEILEAFGNKTRARDVAERGGVPVIHGIDRAVSLAEAAEFLNGLGQGHAIMLKAVFGGGTSGCYDILAIGRYHTKGPPALPTSPNKIAVAAPMPIFRSPGKLPFP